MRPRAPGGHSSATAGPIKSRGAQKGFYVIYSSPLAMNTHTYIYISTSPPLRLTTAYPSRSVLSRFSYSVGRWGGGERLSRCFYRGRREVYAKNLIVQTPATTFRREHVYCCRRPRDVRRGANIHFFFFYYVRIFVLYYFINIIRFLALCTVRNVSHSLFFSFFFFLSKIL